jgi:hypothetical protein
MVAERNFAPATVNLSRTKSGLNASDEIVIDVAHVYRAFQACGAAGSRHKGK